MSRCADSALGATGRRPLDERGYMPWFSIGRRSALGRACFVLFDDAGRDAPAVAALDVVRFRPGPDVGAVLTRGGGMARPALAAACFAGVVDERGHLGAEPGGVLGIQVNLVFRGAEAELQSLLRGTAVDVVFERDGCPSRHLDLRDCDGPARTGPVGRPAGCRRGSDTPTKDAALQLSSKSGPRDRTAQALQRGLLVQLDWAFACHPGLRR